MTGRQLWVYRGGTFTDVLARRPHGRLLMHRLLPDRPARYADAAVEGARTLLAGPDDPVDSACPGTTEPLYERGVEADERVAADGTVPRVPGLPEVSLFCEAGPLTKPVPRADTAVDANLSPVRRRHVRPGADEREGVRLMSMQAEGDLTEPAQFRGRDATLPGPVGGIAGMARFEPMTVIETPGDGGCGRPSPDPHQAGEEIDDLRAF